MSPKVELIFNVVIMCLLIAFAVVSLMRGSASPMMLFVDVFVGAWCVYDAFKAYNKLKGGK